MPSIAEDAEAITQNLIGQNGQNCTMQDTCRHQNQFPRLGLCPGGQTFVGWERSKCGVSSNNFSM